MLSESYAYFDSDSWWLTWFVNKLNVVVQNGWIIFITLHSKQWAIVDGTCCTLISIMIVFFLAQKKTTFILNAENKDLSSVLWLRNLNMSCFYQEKKDSHYGNQSTEWEDCGIEPVDSRELKMDCCHQPLRLQMSSGWRSQSFWEREI
jgi:hypothetical protein